MYSEDGACRSVEVAAGATARHVCEMLVQRAHALSDENWGLVECHPYLALGELRYKELWAYFPSWASRCSSRRLSYSLPTPVFHL